MNYPILSRFELIAIVARISAQINQHADAATHMKEPSSMLQSLTCKLAVMAFESISMQTSDANMKNLDDSHMQVTMKPSPVTTKVVLDRFKHIDDQLGRYVQATLDQLFV